MVDFVVPADIGVKSEKKKAINKYLDLSRKLKKKKKKKKSGIWRWQWYQLYLVYLEWPPKSLEKRLDKLEIRETIETIEAIALLRSERMLRRILNTWRDLLLLRL